MSYGKAVFRLGFTSIVEEQENVQALHDEEQHMRSIDHDCRIDHDGEFLRVLREE